MIALALALSAHAGPCGLDVLGLPPMTAVPAHGPAPPEDLLERDAYGTFPSSRSSEHFVVKWGIWDEWVRSDDVDVLIEALETSWDVELAMGYEPPDGLDAFKFNVYLGATGSGAPPDVEGAAGYYWVDPNGWPMIVMQSEAFLDHDLLRSVTAHEFHHALQARTGNFRGVTAGWFWESTAEYVTARVFPENPYRGRLLYAFAEQPYLALAQDAQTGDTWLEEQHAYGTFVFLEHVDGLVADRDLIREVWQDDDLGDNSMSEPVEVLRVHLAAAGHAFDEAWLDHLGRNATWDYPDGDHYRVVADDGLGGWGAVADQVWSGGTVEWRSMAASRRPRIYGSAAIRVRQPQDDTWVLSVKGDRRSTHGDPAVYGARVVLEYPGHAEVLPLEFVEREAEMILDVEGLQGLWLIVGAWTTARDETWQQRFPFDYRVTPYIPEGQEEPGELFIEPLGVPDGGGGCSAVSGAPAPWWLLALYGLAIRRARSAPAWVCATPMSCSSSVRKRAM